MWKSVVFTIVATLFLCWIPIFMFDKGVEQEKTFVSLPEVSYKKILKYSLKSLNGLLKCFKDSLQDFKKIIAKP